MRRKVGGSPFQLQALLRRAVACTKEHRVSSLPYSASMMHLCGHAGSLLELQSNQVSLVSTHDHEKTFEFDHVAGPAATQEHIFQGKITPNALLQSHSNPEHRQYAKGSQSSVDRSNVRRARM